MLAGLDLKDPRKSSRCGARDLVTIVVEHLFARSHACLALQNARVTSVMFQTHIPHRAFFSEPAVKVTCVSSADQTFDVSVRHYSTVSPAMKGTDRRQKEFTAIPDVVM